MTDKRLGFRRLSIDFLPQENTDLACSLSGDRAFSDPRDLIDSTFDFCRLNGFPRTFFFCVSCVKSVVGAVVMMVGVDTSAGSAGTGGVVGSVVSSASLILADR